MRLEFHLVSDVIGMQEEPLPAIRQKKNSSLLQGFKFLKKRYLDGFVSTGNTGALIAGATLFLPLLPGIKRPALLATLPTQHGEVAIIDVGGNVSCKAHHLVQFAQMGVAYQKCYRRIEKPRVGLLNIGSESKKGTSEVRQAYQLLQQHMDRGEFVGNIEGKEVFLGTVDVLVTNGFVGNVLLKTAEGLAAFLLQKLQHLLLGQEAILANIQSQFDSEEHQGAIVCGVEGVVVKCHGQSAQRGVFNGIKGAIQLVQSGLIHDMKQQLQINVEGPV